MLIDTHTHLYGEEFDEDRADVVLRAAETGVGRMYLPAVDSESHEALLDMCDSYPESCFPMMGLHPTSVNNNPRYKEELGLVEEYLENSASGNGKRFYGVGEVGLDLYWSRDYFGQQLEVFEYQIKLAVEYDLPLIIHTRNAWPEMIDTLKRWSGERLRGIMHSFSGSRADYEEVSECGDFYFGIGGVVTFKNGGMNGIVETIPLSRIVLETDAPYLTPAPYRGKRNESSYLPLICQKVADIKGVSFDEVAEATTTNSLAIFGN